MRRVLLAPTVAVFGLILAMALSPPLAAKDRAPDVECEMTFQLKSWSVFYKRGKGEGRVQCDNGEEVGVILRVHAGGLTFGRSEIVRGKGAFSGVYGIDEVFGAYAAAEAHSGAVKSTGAYAMTKGPVSLALTGFGRGWDIGLTLGRFKIKPVRQGSRPEEVSRAAPRP